MPRGRWQTKLPDRDVVYRTTCPDLWKQYDLYYPDRNHPGKSALVLALFRLLSKLATPLPVSSPRFAEPSELRLAREGLAETRRMMRAFREVGLQSDISELLDWLAPPLTEDQKIEYRPVFEQSLKASGFSDRDASLFLVHGMQPRRGARISNRQRWLSAWDKKLAAPQTTFLDLAETCCSCEKPRHDRHCAETIRQGVVSLRKLARKHWVLDFAESLAQHPAEKRKRR